MKGIEIPLKGEFYVRNGKLYKIIESEIIDFIETEVGLTIWIPTDGEGDFVEYVASDSDR